MRSACLAHNNYYIRKFPVLRASVLTSVALLQSNVFRLAGLCSFNALCCSVLIGIKLLMQANS